MMNHFCLLKDLENYVPQGCDLTADQVGREYWLKHFEEGFARAMELAAAQYGREARKRIDAAGKEFTGTVRKLREDPGGLLGGKLSVLELDRLRERVLREHGLHDPYANIKSRANTSAITLYPQVVRKLHAMADDDKWLHLIECVFAGNLFDLGSMTGVHLADNPAEFLSVVEGTKPRPWLVDDYDRLAKDLLSPPPLKWGKAVVFIDNAGPDFVLGVMPVVRELALYGTKIVLAANEGPALNDMTVDETIDVLERLAVEDFDLSALVRAGMFEVVSSGSRIPLLDLGNVSEELNEAAADAELVILEGMGRAVETNFDAAFKVDGLNLALIKNSEVAGRIGGEVYDCVCRYVPADTRS